MSRQMSVFSRSWLLGIVLVTLTVAVQADQTIDQKIAACPPTRGYTTLQDTTFKLYGERPAGKVGMTEYTSATAAQAACSADNNCVGFDYSGFTIAHGTQGSFTSRQGSCTYLRKRCPVKSGYTAMSNVIFDIAVGSSIYFEFDTIDEAMQACDRNPNCPGFNSNGNYVVGSIIGYIPTISPSCTYIKDTCPFKYGYTNLADTALAGVTGVDGVAVGQLSTQAEAAEFCKLEYRCSGYSSDGSYYIGGISNTVSSPGVCSYIKNSCAPMAGFVAYADSDFRRTYDGQKSDKCFADVYKSCLADSTCKAFNNMRYIWTSLPNNIDEAFASASGVCTYVRLEDVLAQKNNSD
ncbi:hypothetical protein VaNZ11_008505 [Volvox africanus]|uniref:Uncharacterized protein n=1 Tax=Volvox africanus TaxID=51714 RepID=A0ABQ5S6E6_9CHLO|nr:hypothetical protein VaNZ11_008505 [Volvox africanus]